MALCFATFNGRILAANKFVDDAQRQLERLQISKASALDAVRKMKIMSPNSAQMDVLKTRYQHAKDVFEISASQTASVLRGTEKLMPTLTESALEAQNSLGQLIEFVKKYEAEYRIPKGASTFSIDQQKKSALAKAAGFAWKNREEILKLAKMVKGHFDALAKANGETWKTG